MVKHPAVAVLCRAVSWYHSPNGTEHWSRIIKLCEQPSLNCFIVSEWDESRRGFFSMSTFTVTLPPPTLNTHPHLSEPLSALNKHTGHSDRPCSLRGINNTEVNPDSLHPVSVSLSPSSFSFCLQTSPLLLFFALSLSITLRVLHSFNVLCFEAEYQSPASI